MQPVSSHKVIEAAMKSDPSTVLSEIVAICPALASFTSDEASSTTASSLPEYWQHVHLMLTLRVLIARTSKELAATAWSNSKDVTQENIDGATPSELSQRLSRFRELLAQVEDSIRAAEESEDTDDDVSKSGDDQDKDLRTSNRLARLFRRLTEAYKLKPVERKILQFLITAQIQPSTCSLFLVLPATRDYYSSLPGSGHGGDECMAFIPSTLRYVSGATALEFKALANDDHKLIKDRIVVFERDDYDPDSKLNASPEAIKALMDWTLSSEEKLKLMGSKLVELLQQNQSGQPNPLDKPMEADHCEPKMNNDGAETLSDSMADILQNVKDFGSGPRNAGETDSEFEEDDDDYPSADDDFLDIGKDMYEGDSGVGDDITKPSAFANDLEYINQYFDIAMHKVALARQRTAEDRKNAALEDAKPRYGMENKMKQRSVGEIQAKLRLAERKMALSLSLNRQQRDFYPRLELLSEQLKLDDFQKFVLVFLTGTMVSPIFKSCMDDDGYGGKHTTVGDVLITYFETFAEQVAARTYFYKSSTLFRKGIVKVIDDYSYSKPLDLTEQMLLLDRRVLETIVGLDKESSEISQGSNLYEPKVSLDAVVLPDKLKDTMTEVVSYFAAFREYRKNHPDFDEAVSYGVGLTIMLCGKSGTGKTMTANAIASKLGKKLLLVNFPLLDRSSSSRSKQSKFQSIFREAELSDAIIFFDECESLFSRRSSGGSFDTTELLTELERFEGIVFLATNRPYDLDEAMYRRINEVFEFKAPNYLERLEIWKLVTSHEAIPCDPSIDWESIALKYELTGGFIKNAVISALLDGVGRNPQKPYIVESDILNGCKKQVRGALQMVDFDERVVPKGGLSDLIVGETVMKSLSEMISLEKARGILFGSWGFDEAMRSRQGTTALFWGPPGTGRSRAAEAIGFELGKPLKVVDLPMLFSSIKSGAFDDSIQDVKTVFQEARLQDAILVLDGFSMDIDQAGHHGGTNNVRLLDTVVREMGRFPGVVVMMIDTVGSLDVFVSRIDKSLMKSLKFVVEFQLPNSSQRKTLWKKLMPGSLPLAEGIDYGKLAESSSKFSVSEIGNVIYRAAATAAMRPKPKERAVAMGDIFAAIEEEKTRGESSVDRWVKSQYI